MSLRGMIPRPILGQNLSEPHASVRNFVFFRWLSPRAAKWYLDLELKLHEQSNKHRLGLCAGGLVDGVCLAQAHYSWGLTQRWYIVCLRGQKFIMTSWRPWFNWMQRTSRPLRRKVRKSATTRLLGHRLFYKRRPAAA